MSPARNTENMNSSGLLKVAGLYNLVFGIGVILFPSLLFDLCNIAQPRYPEIWQCVGMIVGVYGIGYLIAASNPHRHWPIILVGLLGKLFGPIGFLYSAVNGVLPWSFGILIFFNDLIWWFPFGKILAETFRDFNLSESPEEKEFHQVAATAQSLQGRTMTELSWRQPTLFIFLRHFGCTFCRETLDILAKQREQIEKLGLSIAIVHMGDEDEGTNVLERYDLRCVEVFNDPSCEIYRACGIGRATYRDIFNLKNMGKAFSTALLRNYGIGKIAGDVFRLSGAAVIHQGKIIGDSKPTIPSDRLEFFHLAQKYSLKRNTGVPFIEFPNLDLTQLHELS